jgi:hypothetical protein
VKARMEKKLIKFEKHGYRIMVTSGGKFITLFDPNTFIVKPAILEVKGVFKAVGLEIKFKDKCKDGWGPIVWVNVFH